MSNKSSESDGPVTFQASDSDRKDELDEIVAEIYPELKQLAHFQLSGERAGHTLSTTAIVNEAFLRMRSSNPKWNDRAHFLRVAARVMRHLLVDHARKRLTEKRGAGAKPVDIEQHDLATADDTLAVLAVDAAMNSIGEIDARLEKIIECRFFAGLTVAETSETLDIPLRTVERDWQRARAYIRRALKDD